MLKVKEADVEHLRPRQTDSYCVNLLLQCKKEKCLFKCWQVSVLTDQVEAQGAKISDLQSSLVEHQQKLRSTGEMLQQVNSSTCLQSPSILPQTGSETGQRWEKTSD